MISIFLFIFGLFLLNIGSYKYKKWADRPVSNWALVCNQLSMDANLQNRIMKYEKN